MLIIISVLSTNSDERSNYYFREAFHDFDLM